MKTSERKIFIPLLLAITLIIVVFTALIVKRSSSSSQAQNNQTPGPGNYSYSLKVGNLERTYLVHVPSGYAKGTPVALVLAFHGGGGSAESMAANYNWISKSDQEGIIVAFPNGTSGPGGISTWNAGDCCGYAQRSHIDDVGFVKALLSDMESKFDIDDSRVFATGMSNGGMFIYRLACELHVTFIQVEPTLRRLNSVLPRREVIHGREDKGRAQTLTRQARRFLQLMRSGASLRIASDLPIL